MNKSNSMYITIATVFSNLLNKHFVTNGIDEKLVIEALQRSNNSLHEASLFELGAYLSAMDEEQLKGLANNIKGIFHELKYVEQINNEDNGITAELFGDTNHAGSDVILKNSITGEIIDEVQLKATSSTSYIAEHIEKYTDIKVLTTSEVADRMNNIESTNISNEEISSTVKNQFEELSDLSIDSQVLDSVATSGLLSAAFHASEVISGKKETTKAGKEVLEDIGIATSTTALVSLLFDI